MSFSPSRLDHAVLFVANLHRSLDLYTHVSGVRTAWELPTGAVTDAS